LKEPSRPYTPASLDARTELDIYTNRYSLSSTNNEVDKSSNVFPESKQKAIMSMKTNRRDAPVPANERISSDLSQLVHDLQDAILSVETELNMSRNNFNRLEKLLTDITISIDRFARYIRNDESSYTSGIFSRAFQSGNLFGRLAVQCNVRLKLLAMASLKYLGES